MDRIRTLDGSDIWAVQELLGHVDVTTSVIDLHVLNQVRGPAERL